MGCYGLLFLRVLTFLSHVALTEVFMSESDVGVTMVSVSIDIRFPNQQSIVDNPLFPGPA